MEGYFLWAIVGGLLAFIIVFLGYMGFFSVVQCVTKETEELILAYSNFNAPFLEIDHHGRLLRNELMKLCPNVVNNTTEVHIYYDDPRFTNPLSRWAVAFEVTEDVLDILALNSVSYVRIPAGICLAVEFPYRNFISYGIGIRKAFDTLVSTASKKRNQNRCSTDGILLQSFSKDWISVVPEQYRDYQVDV